MINAKNIYFFKDLTQLKYQENYYDLHNDYDCTIIDFNGDNLSFKLKKIKDKTIVILKFSNASITKINFFNEIGVDRLTINILYRGRFEKNGELLDISENNQSYFYMEFEEGQTIEFWAENIIIEPYIPKE